MLSFSSPNLDEESQTERRSRGNCIPKFLDLKRRSPLVLLSGRRESPTKGSNEICLMQRFWRPLMAIEPASLVHVILAGANGRDWAIFHAIAEEICLISLVNQA